MAKLVFDIETTAQPLENFDAVQQEYLFREAENIPDLDARARRKLEIERCFSLWPMTGHVVCIAMLNAETCRGKVLYLGEHHEESVSIPGGVEFMPCADEAQLLDEFWEVAVHLIRW